ncbi:MAG: histidine phosphatase family protein [Planctomycetes bacterium]|nr:histidine phosphatase family protein [Planctomycetota bacterium]
MENPTPTKITAIRHGETVWNLEGRQQGQLNSELTEVGVKQAQALASALAGKRFDVLYSSDLGRAVQTAEIIAARIGLAVLTDPRLRERHLGIMQTLTKAEFAKKYPHENAEFNVGNPDYIIPKGESARQRYERATACAEELAARHPGESIVIVTHGGILDSLFRYTVGFPLELPRPFTLFNASINTFTVSAGRWRLDTWGDIHHLGELDSLDDR